MRNVEPSRARSIRIRMALLCGLLALGLGIVVTGAYDVAVRDGEAWRDLADRQRLRRLHVTPKRGSIHDRNGTPLAISVEVPSVSVDAVEMLRGIQEKYASMRIGQYAARIGDALGLPADQVAEKLSRRRRFAWLKRRVTKAEVEAVHALMADEQRYPIRGLIIEGEGRRFYPHRELAGPVLGFVSPDGMGKAGVETTLDRQLRGRPEEIRGLRDRAGRLIFAEGIQDEAALAGHDLYLTIDQAIQFIAESELLSAVKTNEAKGGSVVVIDPISGELLALANAPGFNPNDYDTSSAEQQRNAAVADSFEPGSVMKVFSMAAALAESTVTPTAQIYCEEGHMPIDNVVIHDTHANKWLSPTQILQVSSNIGIAKIALGLGERRLHNFFRRFGFGERTGVPLPGEAAGVLRPAGRPWVPVETAAAAFGQGVSTTNLQLAMAMAAVANGGRLLEPTLVRRITDSAGSALSESAPRVRRRAISPRVARVLAEMLSAVTEGEGTGVEAAVMGFRVAGKTSTAQKIDPTTRRYTDTHYVATFLGFVPADQPRLVISVVIDEPTAGSYAGGAVAAPVFRRIAEMSLRYLGVRPRGTKPVDLAEVAEYAKRGDPAQKAYAAIGARPAPGDRAPGATSAERATGPAGGPKVRVPELAGLPLREVLKKVVSLGLEPVVEGTGQLASVDPPAGTSLPAGSRLVLVFEPES
ncbi:MAG: PASTA domain-containing protein [Deltaproteobacteria bacterium]|nr:PASTA domain-containing protein [Deltaproteobacteria bacterium]